MAGQKKFSILIPVYNEAKTVEKLIGQVMKVKTDGYEKEVIVVDDGSMDNTRKILQKIGKSRKYASLRIYFHPKNKGKGAALRTALSKASGFACIVQDADLEYDPREIIMLLDEMKNRKADAVYGSRFLNRDGLHKGLFYFGNKGLTWLTNIIYGARLTDMETCYKLVKTSLLRKLRLRANKFDFEPEVTGKLLRHGIKIWEIPISYKNRDHDEGKKITIKDGLQAAWCLIKYRFAD
ncbi:MAG: dolichyl-phosphate mannose synthase-like protein [archaeon GW2011_AR3]|nr:MAG: dolichyl-phosphate mannose synthase-like protein [archaeon GW2011_AR3]MBS3109605.1 glycosyltransferase family 2 protein [Candidatus Woesearchaeota archaeon]